MRIDADLARCEGHGLCSDTAPEVFDLDEEGLVRVLVTDVPADLRRKAELGARVCPVAALKTVE